MIMPPCIKNGVKCEKREVGCQAKCQEYLTYKEKRNAEGLALAKDKLADSFRGKYIADTKDRLRKHISRRKV